MKYKWGDLITLEYGKPVKDKDSKSGNIPVFGTNGQIGTSHLPPLCPHASFILGRKGAYRGVHYSDVPFSVIDTAFYAKNIRTDILSLKWAYYKFLTYDINRMDSGSAIPSTDRYEIYGIEVELPPIKYQQKIVCLLEFLNKKIELNNRINDNLQQQAMALFDSWFVSFNRTNGEVPADWTEGTLGDISTIISGKRPPMKQAVETDGVQIPLVGASSIMGFTNAVLYNEPILVTGRVGTHGVVQRFQTPCWTSDNTLVIKSSFYEFTYQVLQRVDYVNMNRGSTQPLITQTDLKNVSIVLPPKTVLLEFEELAGSLMAMYEANRKENNRLAVLRDSLLPKLMSGELDVSDIDL